MISGSIASTTFIAGSSTGGGGPGGGGVVEAGDKIEDGLGDVEEDAAA